MLAGNHVMVGPGGVWRLVQHVQAYSLLLWLVVTLFL